MADFKLPRVFIVRHGETEWSLNGRHTGKTDIPLTPHGEEVMKALGERVAGPGKLLDPVNIQQSFISPRKRAQRTFELLFAGSELPPHVTEEDVQEWDYGVYEGRLAGEIRENSDPKWQIWEDGCPGGESAAEMTARVDRMIEKILELHQFHLLSRLTAQKSLAETGQLPDVVAQGNGDVLIVSHGHFTRCFLTRWCQLSLSQGRIFVADAGAISIGGYQHNSFQERSLLGVNLFGSV